MGLEKIADPSAAPAIGPALQGHRKARGLTLEQLAGLSGVSKSMLSEIERGRANPTFAVLWSLTRALGVAFDELVDGRVPSDPEPIEVVPTEHLPLINSPDGACRLKILSPPHLAGSTEWYEIEIAPGGRHVSGAHAKGAIEHFAVIEGRFEVGSGAARRTIGAGEVARYPADVAHELANAGAGPAKGMLIVLFR